MRSPARLLVAGVALFLIAGEARALDPSNAISQYGHTAWRVREGSFPGPPAAVAQTSDGFLWIGTEAGLLRFDGVRFDPWKPPGTTALPDERIVALLGTRDGSLWIGSASGLSQWKDGTLTVHATVGRFGALIEDRNGVVWAGHTRALSKLPTLCRMERGTFRCIAAPGTPSLSYIGAIYEDRRGEVWLGGGGGVCRWRSGNPECYPIAELAAKMEKVGVFAIGEDSDGHIWGSAASAGTWRLVSGKWEPVLLDTPIDSETILSDRAGGLWIGTLNRGLLRRIDNRIETFAQVDGLSGDIVRALFEDREGNVWVATSSGLDRFRNIHVATVTRREGLTNGFVLAVTASRQGGVWVADRNALVRLRDGQVMTHRPVDFPPGALTSLFEDSRGRLWIGIENDLGVLDRGRFARITRQDGANVGIVLSLIEDRDGDVWAVTLNADHALVRIRGGRVIETFARDRVGTVRALVADPNGGVWLGLEDGELRLFRDGRVASSVSNRGQLRSLFLNRRGLWAVTKQGVQRFRNGKVDRLSTANGLPCDDIESAVEGDDGTLWLKTSCGLVRIAPAELDAWSAQPQKRVQVSVLDALDGVQAGLTPFTPRADRSLDGKLWFAIESGGLQVFDPQDQYRNVVPPPVHVLRVIADQKTYATHGRLQLPPLTRDLQIDYTALSFSIPQRVRFRYRLDGADSDWHDVGTRRQAFYSNLGHGSYRFRVIACNDDGVWNDTGATVAFVIPPAFYQTRLFLGLCFAAVAFLAWLLYRLRLRQVRTRMEHTFEHRLAERTEIAREIHDTLLQGFLSSSMQLHVVIEELPADSPSRGKLQRVQELMRQVIEEGRMVLRGLRGRAQSSDDLEQVLARVPDELGMRDAAGLRIIVDGTVRPLRPAVRDEVHRIAREALVNAFRHAHAHNIEVELEYGARQLRVVIRDDGRGIDPEVLRAGREDHWGLSGMRERAEQIGATLKVWSRADAGTEVELTIPGSLAFED